MTLILFYRITLTPVVEYCGESKKKNSGENHEQNFMDLQYHAARYRAGIEYAVQQSGRMAFGDFREGMSGRSAFYTGSMLSGGRRAVAGAAAEGKGGRAAKIGFGKYIRQKESGHGRRVFREWRKLLCFCGKLKYAGGL